MHNNDLGDLPQLATSDKDNLVDAINEVARGGANYHVADITLKTVSGNTHWCTCSTLDGKNVISVVSTDDVKCYLYIDTQVGGSALTGRVSAYFPTDTPTQFTARAFYTD